MSDAFIEITHKNGRTRILMIDSDGTEEVEKFRGDGELHIVARPYDRSTGYAQKLEIDLYCIDGKPEKVT